MSRQYVRFNPVAVRGKPGAVHRREQSMLEKNIFHDPVFPPRSQVYFRELEMRSGERMGCAQALSESEYARCFD